MENFITEYWPYIIAIAPLLFKLLNKVTPGWYRYNDVIKRGVLLLVELLDLYRTPKSIANALDPTYRKVGDVKKAVGGAGLLVVVLMVGLVGCANWQVNSQQTLNYVNDSATVLWDSAAPLIAAACNNEVNECIERGDEECPRLFKCQEVRRSVAMSVVALKFAILDAQVAIDIGDAKSVDEAILKTVALLADIRRQLTEIGVL